MIDPATVVAAFESAGFTHLVWVPDSHIGTWESALASSKLGPIRVTREGESIGVAAGLMLGGARPLVAIQCTGFFEAGDAVRNVVHDLKLPLKMIVGVRSWHAHQAGKSTDNCATYTEKLVRAWDLNALVFDPETSGPAELAAVLAELTSGFAAGVVLWLE